MELIKENVKVSKSVIEGHTQCMCDGDVIVPDVKPDILKILQVDAVSYLANKSVSDGRVSLDGRVELTILYIPDTDRERIKSISAIFNFDHRIDHSKIMPGMIPVIEANVERVEFSLINSRKLRLRAIVSFEYELIQIAQKEIAINVAGETKAEIKRKNIAIRNIVDIFESDFHVTDHIEIPNGQHTIREILKADATVGDCEYKSISGKIVSKGSLNVCVLYTDENNKIEFTEAEIPFTEVFDCMDCTEDTICDMDYELNAMECVTGTDSDGDCRIINIEVGMTVFINATHTVELEMIQDCYEPGMKTTLIMQKETLDEIVARPIMNNTIRETVEFGNGIPGVEGVYNVITKAYNTKTTVEKNKMMTEGYVESYILYLTDSGENPIYSLKKNIPYSYVMDVDCESQNISPNIKVRVKHTGYSLNVANELELRCIIEIRGELIRTHTLDIISETKTEQNHRTSGIVIYFVQPGDNLWSVAKQYGVSQKSIMDFNKIGGEKLDLGMRLFIPGK